MLSPRRQASLKAVLLVSSLAISLGLLEIAARHLVPLVDCPAPDHRIPDPTFGWRLEPGARFDCSMPEATARVAYNAEGWRDAMHPPVAGEEAHRVVVLGDSFMEAYSVDLVDAFSSRLEIEAGNAGVPVEVINFGVGGFGTLQEYLVFREEAASLSPDLVLLAFYVGNDLGNNSHALEVLKGRKRASRRPFLDPGLQGWSISQVDYPAALRRYESMQAPVRRAFRSFQRRSALLTAAVRAIKAGWGGDGDDSARELRGNGMYRCDEVPEYTQAWSVTRRIFERLNTEVTESGARLIVFAVPAFWEVDLIAQDRRLRTASSPGSLCIEEAPSHSRLRELLDDLRISHVDLLEPFRAATREQGETLFYESDPHWNATGHALAAKTVFAALRERGLL